MNRAIIQARMGSSRLRGKSLMPVAGLPLLHRVIETVRGLSVVDEVMVATTDLPEDEPVVSVAKAVGVQVYRGSALDVLDRFAGAAADMDENDNIIRFTADNPMNHYEGTIEAYNQHKEGSYDYTHVDGLSHIVAEFIRVRALREAANSLNADPFDREHVTPYFRKHRDSFRVYTLPADFAGLRHDLDKYLTIDNSEDMYRVESMMKELNIEAGASISLQAVYKWLDEVYLKHGQPGLDNGLAIDFNGTPVGDGYPSYIIAEIGQNHNGDVRIAKKLIDMAVRCGASAVKFQKRDIPSELTKEAYDKPYDNPNSFGRTYGEHRIFLELNEAQHLELKEYALAAGITYFCTPCDVPSVELMERIGCPFYKVASRDLTNIPLLEKLGKTGKPVIISTGMADFDDIDEALKAMQLGKDQVVIMQCTSEYPCKLENVNLRAMETLRKKYGHLVGLSDHTSGVIVSAAAAVMGAVMIEKHITLDRTMKGTDQPGSLEEAGLKKLVEYIRATEIAKGDGEKVVNPATKAAKEKLARSITSKIFISKGTVLTEEMLTLKSPGTGLKWVERFDLLGKVALHDIEPDVTLSAENFA
jgi:sialic acid synthase SpsE/spore coat polysaccharide biosynthesis protein SpsF (cytidylyltransferase family)